MPMLNWKYIKILCYPLGDVFDSASDPVPLPPARPPTRDNPKHGSSLNRTPSDYDLLIPPLGWNLFLKISKKPPCLFFHLVSELSEIRVPCNADSLGSESVWIRMDSSGDGALKFMWSLFHSEDWSNGVNSWPSDFYKVVSSCTKCSL